MPKIELNLSELRKLYKLKKKLSIKNVSSINNPKNNSLIYCLKLDTKYLKKLDKIRDSLIIINRDSKLPSLIKKFNQIIYTKNPKYEFIKILEKFEKKLNNNDHLTLINSKIPSSTMIEPLVFIDKNVKIGENCLIKTGSKIFSNVMIGNNSIIGPNTVVGYKGFGIDRDQEITHKKIPLLGKALKMKHFGGVKIGEGSDIGALNTIVSGVMEPTILGRNVVTDDHVHIAHNCKIEDGVAITASVQLSGGVCIGSNSWIGPNSSIMQKVKIGKKNIVGISTTIYRNTPDNTKWLGNPARKVFK